MGEIKLSGYICDRCDHAWLPRINSETKPTVCPKCKSPYWNIPRKLKELEKKEVETMFPWEKKKTTKKIYDE